MKPKNALIDSLYDAKISTYEWEKRKPRAVVIILHGMAEHALRYERFATALVENGYAVMAMDLRGHGQTGQRGGIQGHFGGKQSDIGLLGDVQRLTMRALDIYGNVPVILMGHSMGTVIAQCSAIRFNDYFRGMILSGPSVDNKNRRAFTPLYTKLLGMFGQNVKPSRKLHNMTFSKYNLPYGPNPRTEFEWLSRDEAEVNKYIADPKCGFVCTPELYNTISRMLLYALSPARVRKMPDGFPIYIVAGSDDPVGGKPAVDELTALYSKRGLPVSSKIYEGGRHELLNDLCADEVTQDIIKALDGMTGGSSR